jgi:hypothetical protein
MSRVLDLTVRKMQSKAKLRFGVFCRDLRLSTWEAEAVRQLLVSGLAEAVVVVPGMPEARAEAAVERWSTWTLFYRLYQAFWLRPRSRALAPADFTEWLADLEVVAGPVTADTLRPHRLDFAIRFGSAPVPIELLAELRFGVWAFDRASLPAAPACFWEVARGQSRTEVSLVRLQRGEGAAEVLHRGSFGTCKASWVNNLDRALLGAADFCARVCAEIAASGNTLGHRPGLSGTSPTGSAQEQPIPTNGEFLLFLARAACQVARKAWELLFHLEVWNVGFSRDRLEEIVRRGQIDHSGVTWCRPHRPGSFIADPFAHGRDGQEQILVEEYDEGDRGRICRLRRPRAGRPLELEVEIEEPYHMSYPCLFSEDGQLYCVPETYQANGARLYQHSNGRWNLLRTIVEGQPIVDPTLFRYANHYWLLCTLQNDGAWGNLKLHGFYSESLASAWKPHPLNPLKCDIGSTRPAGRPVEIDGTLYRPSQDCSDTYGGALVINRVLELSPTEFMETIAATIRPPLDGPYPHGLHTMNSLADGTVIDGKKFVFDLRAWRFNRGRLHEVFR